MKKILGIVLSFILITSAFSQSDRYQQVMTANVAVLDTIKSGEKWLDMANAFQRIADAEKTQWLPYYYAALGQVMYGYMQGAPGGTGNAEKTDPLADKAEELIIKAESLSKDNSEIYVVRKMIATLRMMADPMNRYQTYGPQAAEALERAKKLNPDNPRVYLLEGQDKFYTPEQFGGSKTEAKTLFEESMKKYETFKPTSSIDPQWGLNQVKYFYSLCK
ncbi:MAG TPA: hypothetical protein VM012_00190 [Flavitalea sp.]|nr:hypothetical protein [Flavitalea sp.]